MPHPDLETEQAHIDRARACLEAMRAVTARLVEGEYGGTEVDSGIVRAELEARLRSLSEQSGPPLLWTHRRGGGGPAALHRPPAREGS
ncbi:MAG: hypothetical protein ACRDJL_03900 [Actinomycetota bacterium]